MTFASTLSILLNRIKNNQDTESNVFRQSPGITLLKSFIVVSFHLKLLSVQLNHIHFQD
jgi:hypothetical protein